jgi:hypothetical protein
MAKLKLVGLTATIVSAMAFSFAFADGNTGNTAKPLAGLEFAPLMDTPIEIAVLWGNPQEGESAVMLKFPPNFPGGMHSHTNAYHAVALSEENYLLAQTNILNLAIIDFSRFIWIGLSEYTPFHEFRVFL